MGINYKVEGEGDAVVFIHGLSDDMSYWEALSAGMKNEYKVIRLDLRGHGNSQAGDSKITVELFACDLKNLLDELNVEKAGLIGFSLGGAVALDFALRYPHRTSSIVVMSGFFKCDDYFSDVLNGFKKALERGFDEFYDMILPMILCPDVISNNREELEMIKEVSAQTADCEAYIRACDACMDFNIESELSKISVPALIMAGKYDEISLLDSQKAMHEKIRQSEFIVFENSKHNLLVGKNSTEILEILKKFIKKE